MELGSDDDLTIGKYVGEVKDATDGIIQWGSDGHGTLPSIHTNFWDEYNCTFTKRPSISLSLKKKRKEFKIMTNSTTDIPMGFSAYVDNTWTPKQHMDYIENSYNKIEDKRPKIILSKSRKIGQTDFILESTPYGKKGFFYECMAKEIPVPNLVVDVEALKGWEGYGKINAGSLPTAKPLTYVRDPYKEAEDLGEITSIQTLDIFGRVFGKKKTRPNINFKLK